MIDELVQPYLLTSKATLVASRLVVALTDFVARARGAALGSEALKHLAIAIVLALPAVALAQAPAATPPIRTEKVSGFEVQFVGTPWRPDTFEAMESGGAGSGSQRSWAFARLVAGWYFAIDGRIVPPGRYALTLNPKAGSLPMTLELRRDDGRDFFGEPTATAPPPAGESVYKAPAVFAKTSDPVPFLDVTLAGWRDGATITIRYGNRKMAKDLVRAGL